MQKKKRMAGAIAGIGFCILLGSGIALWEHFQGDEKEQQKKTPVSDEVAEIENLNARDHVLDLNHLFEEEDVTSCERLVFQGFQQLVRCFFRISVFFIQQGHEFTADDGSCGMSGCGFEGLFIGNSETYHAGIA